MTFCNSPPSLPSTFSFLSFSPFCLWCLDIVLIVKQKIITIILPKRKARHNETEELAQCYAGNKEWWQDLNPGIVTAKPVCLYYTAHSIQASKAADTGGRPGPHWQVSSHKAIVCLPTAYCRLFPDENLISIHPTWDQCISHRGTCCTAGDWRTFLWQPLQQREDRGEAEEKLRAGGCDAQKSGAVCAGKDTAQKMCGLSRLCMTERRRLNKAKRVN